MKISFDDSSYINVDDSESGSIVISVAAKSSENRLVMIINSVELTKKQLIDLFATYIDGNKNEV